MKAGVVDICRDKSTSIENSRKTSKSIERYLRGEGERKEMKAGVVDICRDKSTSIENSRRTLKSIERYLSGEGERK